MTVAVTMRPWSGSVARWQTESTRLAYLRSARQLTDGGYVWGGGRCRLDGRSCGYVFGRTSGSVE